MDIKGYEQIYRLFDRGFKQKEIARILKKDQATVSRALADLKQNYPQLFAVVEKPQTIKYDPLMNSKVETNF